MFKVARRHGLSPQQLFGWRAKVRAEIAEVKTAETSEPMFAPAVIAPVALPKRDLRPKTPTAEAGTIEIAVGGGYCPDSFALSISADRRPARAQAVAVPV